MQDWEAMKTINPSAPELISKPIPTLLLSTKRRKYFFCKHFSNIFPSYVFHTFSGVCSVQIQMIKDTQIAQKPFVNGTQQIPVNLVRNTLVTWCKTWWLHHKNSFGYFIKCSYMPSPSLTPVVPWLFTDGSTYQILNVVEMFPSKWNDMCFTEAVGKSTCCT